MFVVVRLLVLVLLILATHRASAQDGPVPAPAQTLMMLPITENDAQLSRLRRVAEAVGRELSQRGVAHLPYAESAALFQKRHSREPRTVSRENIEALVQESQRASRAAAARHANETKHVVAEAQARGADALESLNRDEAGARAYFSTCLALIRVLVADDQREAALKVARDCQAAVPDLAPNPHDHPPSVMQVFDEVQRLAAAEGLGTLYVESEPTDCRVLLNGRLVGTTPYTRQAPVGHTYGVQVECGDPLPGRVHEVTLKAAPTTVAVDVFLDRSVRTSRRALRLSYPRPEPSSARLHAAELARIVGADDVVLLASDDAQGLELHLLRRGTSARLTDDGEESLHRAVDTLLSDPPPPPPEPAPAPASRLAPTTSEAPPARSGAWLLPTGASLAGAGLVLGVVGALRYRAHVEHGEDFRLAEKKGNYLGTGGRWRDSRPIPYALVGVGSALAATGGIMLSAHLSPTQRRWLSPLLAAAGIGVLVAGVVDLRRGSPCPSNDAQPCIDQEQQLDRGALLMVASAPLLASSLAQLVWLRRGPLTVHATGRSVGATLRF